MSNKVYFGEEAIIGMKRGIDIGVSAVSTTLGYGGKTVFIRKDVHPVQATKDGVTVINSIRLSDPVSDAGLKFIQDVSTKTANDVGDGTTSVCVLMGEIINQGILYMQKGIDVSKFKSGMYKALDIVNKKIDEVKKPANSNDVIKHVATVSANNDSELGNMIGEMFMQIGEHGIIHIEDAAGSDTSIELVKGFQVASGYLHSYFINNQNNNCELVEPKILVVDDKVDKTSHLLPIMESCARSKTPLLVFADDFDFDVMANILKNIERGVMSACLVKYGVSGQTRDEIVLDLCAATGATLISRKKGIKMESITIDMLGSCEKAVMTKEETKLFNCVSNKKDLDVRIADAQEKLKAAKNPFVKQLCEFRLSKLNGVIAICYVGGVTDVERKEKIDRVDDSIRATKAALKDGVVPGGGAMLAWCSATLLNVRLDDEEENIGLSVVKKAITKPFLKICENHGENGGSRLIDVTKAGNSYWVGFNAKTNQVENMMDAGIVDPAMVVKTCINNAMSGAIQFLMSDCLIVDEK